MKTGREPLLTKWHLYENAYWKAIGEDVTLVNYYMKDDYYDVETSIGDVHQVKRSELSHFIG